MVAAPVASPFPVLPSPSFPVSTSRAVLHGSTGPSAAAAASPREQQQQPNSRGTGERRQRRDEGNRSAGCGGVAGHVGPCVLQEWWGIDYEVKNHAIHISQIDDGYKALIRDLYRGKVALEVAEAQHLMEGLDWPGAIKDIQASVKWLKENGSPKAPKFVRS
ncbi:Protein usf [Hordeum vulgare]|nr:Protein usf [Hordeum vulgare]